MTRIHHAPLIALALISSPCAAQAQADLAAIEREVAAFAGLTPAEAAGALVPIDRRLRLAACQRELAMEWYGSRRDTIEVRCPTPGSWKLYVRTLGSGPARQEAASIKRGDEVTVTLSGSGFSVSQSAEALEGGSVGEWIRVKVQKGSELRARVLRPGAVGVEM